MTRKDYVKLAEALREALAVINDETDGGRLLETIEDGKRTSYFAEYGWRVAVGRVADALQSDNPRFDRERFLAAVQR